VLSVLLGQVVETLELLGAVVVEVGEGVLGGEEDLVLVAAAVADDQVGGVGVVGGEGAARAVVGHRAVQHRRPVILEVARAGVAERLTVVILGGRAVATVPWHEARGDVSGIVGGDERPS